MTPETHIEAHVVPQAGKDFNVDWSTMLPADSPVPSSTEPPSSTVFSDDDGCSNSELPPSATWESEGQEWLRVGRRMADIFKNAAEEIEEEEVVVQLPSVQDPMATREAWCAVSERLAAALRMAEALTDVDGAHEQWPPCLQAS
mmetsp:Transcript_88173/g.189257  ORF Transcript_88173/g.189257 Transcript_88173/m.189257 type:complete len:144 (+) Transcript_88173:142-573(+)